MADTYDTSGPSGLAAMAGELRRRLDIDVRFDIGEPIGPSHLATALLRTVTGPIHGFGLGANREQAADLAVAEVAERWAQFAQSPNRVVRGTYTELETAAVQPLLFGMHSQAQYDRAGPRLARFNPGAPMQWIETVRLPDRSPRLVPLELIYPKAPLARPPLTRETSSGTALRLDPDETALTAVCEVVERDALLLMWHRHAGARRQRIPDLPPLVQERISALRAAGHVITVCRIEQDVAIPTCLALAFRGRSFACGLGTSPDPTVALLHAINEMTADVHRSATAPSFTHLPLSMVRTPADHRALYDKGPLNTTLHAALTAVISSTEPHRANRALRTAPLRSALDALAARGLTAYLCDLTPPEIADVGAHVARVLIPGLVPLSFGADGLRLGCARLVGADAPGRLVSLLPHFLG